MKILHIGRNDGSHMSHTVRHLQDKNIDAKGMTFFYSNIIDYSNLLVYKKKQAAQFYSRFIYEALRADLIHLWSIQVPGIITFLKTIKKPLIIEWTGSDIRVPELMPQPYKVDEYEESKELSELRQKPFYNYINIVSSAILDKHLVNPLIEYVPHRFYYKNIKYIDKQPDSVLKVAHAPSARSAKGTEYVLQAALKGNFVLDLIEGVDHQECLKRISDCDIFLDQFVWGEHGMASLEAMAMGKPTLCYITHTKPTGLINVAPDKINDMINLFISNPELLSKVGFWMRCNVENSVDQAVKKLIDIYKTEISKMNEYKKFLKKRYHKNPEKEFEDN